MQDYISVMNSLSYDKKSIQFHAMYPYIYMTLFILHYVKTIIVLQLLT